MTQIAWKVRGRLEMLMKKKYIYICFEMLKEG
jgi:hypothetical protein